MGTIVSVGLLGLFFISLMFKSSLLAWARVGVIVLFSIKWLFIVGFLTAFLNMPQMYAQFGWTPASILFGSEVYDNPPKDGHKKQKVKQQNNR